MFFVLHFLFCGYFCLEFLKDELISKIISPKFKKTLYFFLFLYFFFGFFLVSKKDLYSFLYFILPCLSLLFFFIFLYKRKEMTLLRQIHLLLPHLLSQMKLGLSFMSAWEKVIKDVQNKELFAPLMEVSESLKFEKRFVHSHKELCYLVQDLAEIKKNPQPLKRLSHLKQKVDLQNFFERKSQQMLLQIRLQSTMIAFLYLGLLIWTIIRYGAYHSTLTFGSLFLFCLGLFFIFQIGRKLKWSL